MAYAVYGQRDKQWEPVIEGIALGPRYFITKQGAGIYLKSYKEYPNDYGIDRNFEKFKVERHPNRKLQERAKVEVTDYAKDTVRQVLRNLDNGTIFQVPWTEELSAPENIWFHGAHVCPQNLKLVRFYPTEESCYDGAPKDMTPAKYLIKYYGLTNEIAATCRRRRASRSGDHLRQLVC